jgi:sec-independent protein translocase protein TatA
MGELSPWHWLIIVLVFVLLFGAKRLPDAARALGRSMRILKTEVKGLHDDDDAPDATATPPAALPPVTPPPVAPTPDATNTATSTAAPTAAGDPTDAR